LKSTLARSEQLADPGTDVSFALSWGWTISFC